MRRPWQIWGTFFGCLALVAVAVGWLSLRAWEADRAEFTARELAALEENVRLALWRMDSIVAPFIAQESVRPPAAFQVARRPLPNAEAVPQQAPSPLRGQPPPVQLAGVVSPFEQSLAGQFIQLYFQLNCDGRVTSPQVWYSDLVNEPGGTGSSSSDHEQGVLLDTLRTWIDLAELESQLPPLDAQGLSAPPGTAISPERGGRSLSNADGSNVTLQIEQAVQQSRSVNEFQARRSAMAKKGNPAANNRAIEPPSTGGDYEFSPFRPIVTRGELLLARRARIGAEEFIQGCWLDWKSLEQELEQTVADLLPGSRLELQAAGSADPSRTMASLPIVLIVPVPEPRTGQDNSPVRFSLVLAWGAMSLAALAVAALLGGVVTLSERRASFVSAVTHELRTPLTTFRMYSEMLADGMVTEPAQQTHYLRTLRVEADRLTHLVENVLAYARLERGGLGNRMAATPAVELVATATARAAERAAQGGMEFTVAAPDGEHNVIVWADPSAVEQIVFNLVDNACKYAAQGEIRRIEISTRTTADGFQLRVRDHGPGISAARRRRLFEAFSKSADEAAVTAPGVGLGLALSRRLARDMGGDLEFDGTLSAGAGFVLKLRSVGRDR